MKLPAQHIVLSFLIFYLSFFLFRYSSCTSSSGSASTQNLSNIYKSSQDYLHPSYEIFHRSNTVSELHFRINSKELLYSRQGGNEGFTARISIHYRLISSYETKDLIDSATVLVNDPYSSEPKDIIGKIDFGATFTNSYLLEVYLTDLNRDVTSKSYIGIDKVNHATRQNFLLVSQKEKLPLFRNYVGPDEHFLIRYRSQPATEVFVRYYHRDFPLALPPFSTSNMTPFDYRADSIFRLTLDEKDTTGLRFTKPGFYHVQADTSTKDGITVYRFDDDFPMVTKPYHLLLPLRYITSQQDYNKLSSYQNLKAAVDSFWVSAGGSADRARELVKRYYNRIQNSNLYFSSYIEGWKTDRGLIYLIYGPPNVVYKSSGSENWIYGEENNFNSLTFSFVKVINPFSDNDFRLDRSQVFKTSWYNAVEMWREGKVNTDK